MKIDSASQANIKQVIADVEQDDYRAQMRLFALRLLALVAVLMLPLGMAAPAEGAVHQGTMATMRMQHCPEQAPSHDSNRGFAHCTMACSAALPAADGPQDQHLPIAPASAAPAIAQSLHGLHPETATPPPKLF